MEQLSIQQKRGSRGAVLCVTLLCLLFLALAVRAPFGFDWTDEAYYTVLPYRFVLGDRPMLDTWEVHQFSGMLALPFLRVYLLATGGSMAGVMLYFRYVLICAQLALSIYAFFVLRRRSGDVCAFLCAGLMLTHIHFGLNGFSYNAMAPLCCMASAVSAFDALDGNRAPLKAALSGALYAFAVQAYPYFALSLPVYIVFWWQLVRRGRRTGDAAPGLLAKWFALGIAAVFALFAAYILCRTAGGDLLGGLRGMLGDPDHASESAVMLLAQYANALRVLFGPISYAAALLLIWSIAANYCKNPARRTFMRKAGLIACVLLLFGAVVWVLFYDYPNHHKINLAAAAPALFAPALYFLSGRKRDRSMLLFFLSAALSVAVQLGSNTGIRSSSGMLLGASVAAVAYLFDCTKDIFQAQAASRFVRRATVLACVCQLLLTTGLRLVTVYRDEALPALATVIPAGPAKGIVTTPENVKNYNAVYADLSAHAPDTGYLLVTNLLPVAYLMTKLPPAAPSTFNMTADAAWLAKYYEENPLRVPDCVYAVDGRIGTSNGLSLAGTQRLPSVTNCDYSAEILSGGTLFTRQPDVPPAKN